MTGVLHMEQYFLGNNVAERVKVPVLLTIIGEQPYTILRDMELPKNKTIAELCIF